MCREELKRKLEEVTGLLERNKIVEALSMVVSRKLNEKELAKEFLEKVGFWDKLKLHPLVSKAVDWGNTHRVCKRSELYKRLSEKLYEIWINSRVEVSDISRIEELLKRLRDFVLDYIVDRASDTEQGLRHLHAPGSVARGEAVNLHFGESFDRESLCRLASRLPSSLAIGNSIGVYSDNEELMRELRQLAALHWGAPYMVNLEDIGVGSYERNRPYVVFLKFLIWLMERLDTGTVEERDVIQSLLSRLRRSSITLFFMPTEKLNWCTIPIPRLDLFASRWLDNESDREKLSTFVNELRRFEEASLSSARRMGERTKAENLTEILAQYYDNLCRRILETGEPDFHALRCMLDVVVELAERYEIHLRVPFKELLT